MLMYQSSFLGNEDQDEMDTGFRQVLDIMITPVQENCTDVRRERVEHHHLLDQAYGTW